MHLNKFCALTVDIEEYNFFTLFLSIAVASFLSK